MHLHRHWSRVAGVAAALVAGLLLGRATPAYAQRSSAIQLGPESNRYFISKDVNDERWSIIYNLDDATVTGNVFPVGDGAPTFISCDVTEIRPAPGPNPNPADADYFLTCRFAGGCEFAPCVNQWSDPPQPVGPIKGEFMLPTNTAATYSGNVQPIYNGSCATSAVCHSNGAAYVVLAPEFSYDNTFLVESDGVNGAQGAFVVPFQPDASFLFKKVDGTGAGARMPYNGDPLPQEQIDAIQRWILEGAANN